MRSRLSMTPTRNRPGLTTSVFPPASWKISGCWLRTCAMAACTCGRKFGPSVGQLPTSWVTSGNFEQLLMPGSEGVATGAGVALAAGLGLGELTAVGVLL